MSHIETLPQINSRKEFMDHLSTQIIPPKEETDEEESRGRMCELKTYVIESNNGFPRDINADNFTTIMKDTGVEDLKTLYVMNRDGDVYASFFVDISDKRFISLHTNSRADQTHKFHEHLAKLHNYQFDHTWLTTGMLKNISHISGNKFDGVGINYKNIFSNKNSTLDLNEGMTIYISGGRLASKALSLISGDEEIERTIAYNKVRVIRGERSSLTDFVTDEIDFNGTFAVKAGKSVDDHITLVETVKQQYREQIKKIEANSIGIKQRENKVSYEGKAFDFEFKKPIQDWDILLNKMFDCALPFRLWGLKKKISDGHYSILAVDLHTGDPIDMEITDHLMRVYLPKGSCGNVVLRLFVNLQQYFDSTISSEEIV